MTWPISKKPATQGPRVRRNGQTLIMFVFFIIVLILFVGIGIDVGFAYITKANLAKAVDAACLAGIRSYPNGVNAATDIARSTFIANYSNTNRDTGVVSPNIVFNTSAPNVTLTVTATATNNTFFIRILPLWKTLKVNSSATAQRANVIVTLVLDRSGSMRTVSGGAPYLPGAVSRFITQFDDAKDYAAMISYATAMTNDVLMTHPFRSAVTSAVSRITFDGGTFSQGGLTNAFAIAKGFPIPTGSDAVKIVVFFTDGRADGIQDVFNCPAQTAFNYGMYDSQPYVSLFFTNCAATETNQYDWCPDNGSFTKCTGATTFPSHQFNTQLPINHLNVCLESAFRAVQVANDMRNNGMTVYSIGLGGDGVDMAFLNQVANSSNSVSFNPNLPVGDSLLATNPAQLDSVFQQIADKILTRLTK